MNLSKIANNLGGSIIREMFNEAMKMQNTISFTVGEPDFVTPKPLIDAACEAWQQGRTHYTPNAGILPLRKAVAQYHKQAGEFDIDPETQVIVTCGATEAVQLALFTVVNPGDEVILIEPAWPNYFGQIGMVGAIAVRVPALEENAFIPRPANIAAAITPRTRAIILNSPCNPTGAVIDRETYGEILKVLEPHDIWIIADEVYSRLLYTGKPFTGIAAFPHMHERMIYINSFSKMFAMTGWRLGYAISTPEVVRNMTKLHENGASCLAEPGQIAAAQALLKHTGEIEKMRKVFHERRDLICGLINDIDRLSCLVPGGAFYAFVNIKQLGIPSKEFCLGLLRNTGVVIVPGMGFGDTAEGYVRFTYAASNECIEEGLRRVKKYVDSLAHNPLPPK